MFKMSGKQLKFIADETGVVEWKRLKWIYEEFTKRMSWFFVMINVDSGKVFCKFDELIL
jgi:hypothetical protein